MAKQPRTKRIAVVMPDGIDVFDIFGRYMCWAWKTNSPYTSYLFYADPKGHA
jgi:hypothetical protein